MTFQRILVPTDFGEAADRALDLAVTIAGKFESQVTILHVFHLPPITYAEGLYLPIDDMLLQARKVLDGIAARAKSRHPKVQAVLLGQSEPYEQILRAVKDRDIDLVVMGTHGRRGVSHVLLGSVAEKVLRLSPVPVLTVTGGASRGGAAANTTTTAGDRP